MWTEWNDGIAVRLLNQFLISQELDIFDIAVDAMEEGGEDEGWVDISRIYIKNQDSTESVVRLVRDILIYPSYYNYADEEYREDLEPWYNSDAPYYSNWDSEDQPLTSYIQEVNQRFNENGEDESPF